MWVQMTLRRSQHPEIEALLAPCRGAYSPPTMKGYGADLRYFLEWCNERG